MYQFNIRKYGSHYDLECFNMANNTMRTVCSRKNYAAVNACLERLQKAKDFQIPKMLYEIEEEREVSVPAPFVENGGRRYGAAKFV